ncbi:phosphatase PAP2 family protein [Streptomyces sp. NPDC057428]|uniref:phosphatase PAP2 family protein n=1 Tax=Streptomyces sp. NPDC057428 TaxID=3346129 RepID=UPI0036A7B430
MSTVVTWSHRARHTAHDVVTCGSSPAVRGTGSAARVSRRGLVVVTAVIAYFGVRGLTDSSRTRALHDAGSIQSAERHLHLDWESSLQSLVVDHHAVTRVLNWIYIFGHWPVITVTLLWLLYRSPGLYARVAGAMLLSGAVGLVTFAAFPVAPPRLAGLGLTDTVTQQSHAYRLLQPPAFTDQYAAMPSLHVGWNLLMTLAVLAATRKVWLRVLAVALTVAMDATVVLTANHYVVDAVAGAALAHLSWYAAGRLQERRRSRLEPSRLRAEAGYASKRGGGGAPVAAGRP